MAASAGNVLDTVLGVGEERYEKLQRWPPPPATSSTLCWESVRGREIREVAAVAASAFNGSLGGEIRDVAAVAASTGNELDTVLGARVERYEKVRGWPPPPATSSTLCWE